MILPMILAATLVGGTTTVNWATGSLPEALEQARAEQKPLLAFFWWDGSEHSLRMREETLQDPETLHALDGYVLFDADRRRPDGKALFEQYNVKVAPTCIFFNEEGEAEDWVGGFVSSHDLQRDIERIRERGEETVSYLREQVAAARKGSNDALEARMSLAGKLEDLGDQEGHDAMLLAIRELDPKGETLAGCRGHLLALQREINEGKPDCAGSCTEECGEECAEGCESEQLVQEWREGWNLKPLYRFAKTAKNPEGKFRAWDSVGDFELARGEDSKAAKAYLAAAELASEDDWQGTCQWSLNTCMQIQEAEEEKESAPSALVKKAALQLATRGVELVEQQRATVEAEWGQERFNEYYSSTLRVLGAAQAFSGKTKNAKKTFQRCLELQDCEEVREQLAALN